MEGKFVAYYRVSTDKQGKTGHGLEAQRQAVTTYLNGGGWVLLKEFTEIESGKRNDRPELVKALHHAKMTGATLLIAKLDRLSRNAAFLLNLRDAGVDFTACDVPDANALTVGLLAVLAQHERETISKRTKDALAAAKSRGVVIGVPAHKSGRGAYWLKDYADINRTKIVETVQRQADDRAKDLLPIIDDIKASGVTSLEGLARELNARGIRTARGGKWYATSVKNVIVRHSPSTM